MGTTGRYLHKSVIVNTPSVSHWRCPYRNYYMESGVATSWNLVISERIFVYYYKMPNDSAGKSVSGQSGHGDHTIRGLTITSWHAGTWQYGGELERMKKGLRLVFDRVGPRKFVCQGKVRCVSSSDRKVRPWGLLRIWCWIQRNHIR